MRYAFLSPSFFNQSEWVKYDLNVTKVQNLSFLLGVSSELFLGFPFFLFKKK